MHQSIPYCAVALFAEIALYTKMVVLVLLKPTQTWAEKCVRAVAMQKKRATYKRIAPATQTGGIVGKTKQMVADALPDFVKQTRVKDSDGKTRTLSEMGVNNYSELQARVGKRLRVAIMIQQLFMPRP